MALLVSSAFALAVACAAFILFNVFSERVAIQQELQRTADIAAQLAAQSYGQGTPAQAAHQLASVGRDDDVAAVFVFDDAGRVFAQYVDSLSKVGRFGLPNPQGPRFEDHTADGYHLQRVTIQAASGRAGTLVMRYSLATYHARIQRYLILAIFVLMGTLVASYGIANRLQQGIVSPLRHLTDTVRTVTQERTFDVRADVPEGDEIGELAEHFNEMLSEIQKRDGHLARHRQYLEQQVAERTADLVRSNEALATANDTLAHTNDALASTNDTLAHTNEALARERDRAEAASQLKTELMTNMSHEFRTPIAGIIGLSSILRDEVEPVHVEFVDLMAQNATRLMDTLSAVLDLSQVESGELDVVPTHRDAAELVRELAERPRKQAEAKGLVFRIDLPAVPVDAIVDGSHVLTVLRHLLSNAVKFTDAGEVVLRLRPTDDVLYFDVADTGIGIAPAQQDDVFEPFVQGSSGVARTHEGNGIGLTISRRMARLLGGDVTLVSTPGRGSVFTFALPRFAELPRLDVSDEHPMLLRSANAQA